MSGTMLKAIFYARFHEEKGMRRVLFFLMVVSCVLLSSFNRNRWMIDGAILNWLLVSLKTGILLVERSRRQCDAAVVNRAVRQRTGRSLIFPYSNSLL